MRIFIVSVLLLAASAAFGFDTYRVGTHIIRVGDSLAMLGDVMGEPTSKEAFVNQNGVQVGTFWYYNDDGKTIRVLVAGGSIRQIEEIRK